MSELPKLRSAWWEVGLQARVDAGITGVAKALPRLIATAFRRAMAADRAGTIATIAITVTAGVLATLGLLTTQRVLIAVLSQGPTVERVEAALPALLTLVALIAVRGGLGIASGWTQTRLEPRLRQQAERSLFEATTAVPLSAYDSEGFTDELERGSGRGVDAVWNVVRHAINLLAGVIGVIAAGAALALLHPLLPVALLAASVPEAWAALRAGGQRYREYLLGSIRRRRVWILTELMARRGSAAELRAYHLRDFLLRQYDVVMDAETAAQLRLARAVTATTTVGAIITGVCNAGVYGLLAGLLITGHLPLAAAATAVVALQSARNSLHVATIYINELYADGRHLRDLEEFLTRARGLTPDGPVEPVVPQRFRTLRLDEVTLRYADRDRPAIDGVSLTIQAGQTVAFVGENGSGKTTLAAVLTGLRAPDQGTVWWDEHRLPDLDAAAVRAAFGAVTQDHWQWPFTAETNIRLGDLAIDGGRDPVEAAARAAVAHEMILDLPHGYATLLDRSFEGGQDLSGGQWQRLAAARGFFKDADLLIMDEPSSALDARAEAALFASVRARHGTKTTVLITHRLANVRHADVIFVLHEGRLVDQGTHDELIARGGLYKTWYDLQKIGYTDA
ncbi:MAG: ABC transporter ATP-binding protein [Hamadaea sp.]|nr:ABC transporter ATP-binding protein [Hamadaea sp.]